MTSAAAANITQNQSINQSTQAGRPCHATLLSPRQEQNRTEHGKQAHIESKRSHFMILFNWLHFVCGARRSVTVHCFDRITRLSICFSSHAHIQTHTHRDALHCPARPLARKDGQSLYIIYYITKLLRTWQLYLVSITTELYHFNEKITLTDHFSRLHFIFYPSSSSMGLCLCLRRPCLTHLCQYIISMTLRHTITAEWK